MHADAAAARRGKRTACGAAVGLIGAASFVIGALASAAAGYVSMHIASQTNIRVASAARRTYQEALCVVDAAAGSSRRPLVSLG